MTKFPGLGFTSAQNEVLLRVGQYVYAFSFLDMSLTFGIVDRLGGNFQAALVTLRGMDFRVRHERLFKLERAMNKGAPHLDRLPDFSDRLKTEYDFRNKVSHAQIGVDHDGTAFLNEIGRGFGQASHIAHKIAIPEIEAATQRCWRLFGDISETFTPARHSRFLATLDDATNPQP